ncbi:MAG: type III secretion fhipep protein [Thermorudis peleae]|nr:type III secretion fhipep protein [Thermorudis peleae]
MSLQNPIASLIRPAEFSRALLHALDASEGRRRRRKRDQTPDSIGLSLKRDVLEKIIAEDPEPEAFEAWLLDLVLHTPGSGGLRAMCQDILQEYRLAQQDPRFSEWLAEGAPSDDALPEGQLTGRGATCASDAGSCDRSA